MFLPADSVYFHLPALSHGSPHLFGISCYKQILASKLEEKDKGSDITRSYVQKALCVITRKGLYGLLHAPLQAMTRVFFDPSNFADYTMLEQLFRSMNNTCSRDVDDSQVFTMLSPRRLVMGLKHNLLGLFKLLFLEALDTLSPDLGALPQPGLGGAGRRLRNPSTGDQHLDPGAAEPDAWPAAEPRRGGLRHPNP